MNNSSDFTPDANKHTDCTYQLKDGEIWVGNTNVTASIEVDKYISDSLKTARLGDQAYDINGKPIERSYCRPLIIHKSEAAMYDKIMMARLSEIRNPKKL